jgi:hypothetical protein
MTEAIARVIGILAGAFLSLVFSPPRSRAGALRRTGAAVVGGFVFGPVIMTYLGWSPTNENIIASSCVSAFTAWSGMGAVKKVAESLGSKDTKES